MAKISIIIPTFNCVKYLPKAIESVLSQTHQELEIIVVDDNSTDSTSSYLSNINDSRMQTITTSGLGASGARNLGISRASGDYIAFLDADDFWMPTKLERQLNFHQSHPELAATFTNYQHVTEQYEAIIDCFGYWNKFQSDSRQHIVMDDALEFVLQNNVIGTSTVMIKAEIFRDIAPFDSSLEYGEDLDLWLRICEQHPLGALNSIEVGYVMRQGSTTQTNDNRLRNLKSLEAILHRYTSAHLYWNISSSALRRSKARILEGYADYHRCLNQPLSAIILDLRSLSLAPEKRRLRSLLGDCKSIIIQPDRSAS
ncbi:glycosyltransferase family 2 protein [Vibrio mediterranei]|uniref:glycosyltransferase family 2 protein n=1 Tax=Vibrio mediterranei TaxID=689 RepID=UPI00148B4A3D|nr:glycosyltransferase family A protein [Vibrio mediterranei]NOI22118.1 glycosyltransferase family 2 protein [Vibrio mediterranei]